MLLTHGGDGALCYDGKRAWHCPAVPVEAVDTTAASDAYLGALAVALAESRPVVESPGFAGVAAALAVTKLGAQPSLATREEVAAFIGNHGIPVAQAVPA